MSKQLGMSFNKMKNSMRSSIQHNERKNEKDDANLQNYQDHIDYSKTKYNVPIVSGHDVRKEFNKLYQADVKEYNNHQRRKDRRVHDYYDKCNHDKTLTPTVEFVVQLGDINTKLDNDPVKNREKYEKLYRDFEKQFEKQNSNLHPVSVTIHFDEASPHMHGIYIPVANGYSRGVKRRPNFNRAIGADFTKEERDQLNQDQREARKDKSKMAKYNADRKQFRQNAQNRYSDWTEKQRNLLADLAKKFGVERKHTNEKRQHLEPDQYRIIMHEADQIKAKAQKQASIAQKSANTWQKKQTALQANVNNLNHEIASKQQEKQEVINDLLKTKADVANYRKKVQRYKTYLYSQEIEPLLKQKKQAQQEVHDQCTAVNDLWGQYKPQMKKLREENWAQWHDPEKCRQWNEATEELREGRKLQYALTNRNSGFLSNVIGFIVAIRNKKLEEQVQAMKEERKRVIEENNRLLQQKQAELEAQKREARKAKENAQAVQKELQKRFNLLNGEAKTLQKGLNSQYAKVNAATGNLKHMSKQQLEAINSSVDMAGFAKGLADLNKQVNNLNDLKQ